MSSTTASTLNFDEEREFLTATFNACPALRKPAAPRARRVGAAATQLHEQLCKWRRVVLMERTNKKHID